MSDEEGAGVAAELPLETAGSQLRRAREAAGLSLAQLAAETRISERQLTAIESGNYGALPGRTYAIGFSRTYAKAVGMDDAAIAATVRGELAEQQPTEQRRTVQTFEPGDPARVPSAKLAWFALAALVAALLAGFAFLPGLFAPGGSLPSILPVETPSPAPAASQPAPVAPVGGPVVFTALEPKVWVKFTDSQGNQLMQKELAQGETWTVPTDKGEVLIWTARPDALAITVGGQAVPKLSDVQKTVKDQPVSAAALLARGSVPVGPPVAANSDSAAQPAPRRQERRAAPAPRERRQPDQRIEASPVPSEPAPAAPAPQPAPSAT